MTDNTTTLPGNEKPQVSRIDDYEIIYWTDKWGITEQELNNAVGAVGVDAGKIEVWLRKNGIIK